MNDRKILIVEDDPGLREALADTLALAGFKCIQARINDDCLRHY